ncbi:MAG: RDD family protein [Nocardioides sp.]
MTNHPAQSDYARATSTDLVTGEAVALDLPPASLGARMAAGLIDVVVTYALLITILFAFAIAASGAGPRNIDALSHIALIGTLVVVFLAVPTGVETLTRGKSLGKLVLGLRTVRDDAGPISFHHAFVRSLIGFVEVYAFQGGPAFFSALISQRGKRLGDYAAGTYVVRERFPMRLGAHIAMPPSLITWAANADIGSLSAPLASATRQFLTRAHQLEPNSRMRIGADLAQQTMPHVAPSPPPGTPAEEFLAAVLAARRDRDSARMQREEAFRRRLITRI